jgi:hypothetical protein
LDSASINTTTYIGKEAFGDINNDGLEDVAFLVTQDNGGSGTFYYVVVALRTPSAFKTTNGYLVGDRVNVQSLKIDPALGELVVTYADRNPDEPMTAAPTANKVLLLKVTEDSRLVDFGY